MTEPLLGSLSMASIMNVVDIAQAAIRAAIECMTEKEPAFAFDGIMVRNEDGLPTRFRVHAELGGGSAVLLTLHVQNAGSSEPVNRASRGLFGLLGNFVVNCMHYPGSARPIPVDRTRTTSCFNDDNNSITLAFYPANKV